MHFPEITLKETLTHFDLTIFLWSCQHFWKYLRHQLDKYFEFFQVERLFGVYSKHKSQFKFFLQPSMIVSLDNLKSVKMETDHSLIDSKRKKLHFIGLFTGVLTLLAIWSSIVLLYLAQCHQEFQVHQLLSTPIFWRENPKFFRWLN